MAQKHRRDLLTASLTSLSYLLILEYNNKPTFEIFPQQCSARRSNPLLVHFAKRPAFYALYPLSKAGHHCKVIQYFHEHQNIQFVEKSISWCKEMFKQNDPQRLSILLLPPHEKFHLSLSNYDSEFFIVCSFMKFFLEQISRNILIINPAN